MQCRLIRVEIEKVFGFVGFGMQAFEVGGATRVSRISTRGMAGRVDF